MFRTENLRIYVLRILARNIFQITVYEGFWNTYLNNFLRKLQKRFIRITTRVGSISEIFLFLTCKNNLQIMYAGASL